MDLQAGIRRRTAKSIITDSLNERYPHDLQLYIVPPGNEISLTEFEDLALERLQLLRVLEQATHKGHKIWSHEWKDAVMVDLRKQRLMSYLSLLDPREGSKEHAKLQARRSDHISHFILRLAYCRSEELRRWFLAREQEWFKLRFTSLQPAAVKTFLDLNNLTYTPISAEEKDSIRSELYDSTAGYNNIDMTNFYKVPFVEVYSLVKSRRIYLDQGFAYIPNSELVTCVLSIFRSQLSEALAFASHRIHSLDDDRLNNLLVNIHTSYMGRDYTIPENKESIDIEHLDQYARKHFPLCMRHIHETFRTTHHMKHGCRMQYGLFIKGIGVTFDNAMRLWREEFTKKVDENTFDKKYSYLVKHNYGKVGSMTNYSPYSCMKIITGAIASGEHHGCPFRHFDATNLKQKLTSDGISNQNVDEILELVKNMHYQIACTKYFEFTHGQPSKNTINHPNQYFEESVALLKDGTKATPAKKAKESKSEEVTDMSF